MPQGVSQFTIFRVKPSVRPEDPSSEEGSALLRVLQMTKNQSGHENSSWGRTSEDPNTLVWVVDWTDARCTINARALDPFLDTENPQPVSSLHLTLSPPISSTETLTKNPVTELCALHFASDLEIPASKKLHADLISFRTALLEQLPQSAGPRSWSMGHVDRPSKLPHETSSSGHAVLHLIAAGWDSVDAHIKARETDKFVESIAPIREKMLAPIPGLEMMHVSFQRI